MRSIPTIVESLLCLVTSISTFSLPHMKVIGYLAKILEIFHGDYLDDDSVVVRSISASRASSCKIRPLGLREDLLAVVVGKSRGRVFNVGGRYGPSGGSKKTIC